jgi:hypothetical protein
VLSPLSVVANIIEATTACGRLRQMDTPFCAFSLGTLELKLVGEQACLSFGPSVNLIKSS